MEIHEKVIYELDAKELKLYLIMVDKFNKNNQQPFQYNTKDISNDIQTNRNYISSILKSLLELNYITIDKVGKNNYYSINNNMEERKMKKIDMSSNKIGIDNISENDKDNYETDGTSKEIAVQINEAKNKVSTVLSKNNLLYDISGDIEAYRKMHKECKDMTDIEIAVEKLGVPKNLFE